tara:strand:+ start:162 stop:1022 length:861 start_codon:yes stop_codon:yes gene_type:complete
MRKFGEIKGYPEGTVFNSRAEIKAAALHNRTVHGISRIKNVGCDCIVLNGGYKDDEDNGDVIIYTGEGGKKEGKKDHTSHQIFKQGNLDLSLNKDSREPIRVIRGWKFKESEYSPKSGYRYDGLYYLEDFWPDETDKDKFRIWRYRLVKKDGDFPPKRSENAKPSRTIVTTSRIDRDPEIGPELKELHDFRCQVCGIRLEAHGQAHAVGAHIRGLGKPNNGDDSKDNMIILCPNDHLIFDNYGFSIDDNFNLIGREGKLRTIPKHTINKENLRFHRKKYSIAIKSI